MAAHRVDEGHQRLADMDEIVAGDHAVVDEQRHVEADHRRFYPEHLAPVAVLLDPEVGGPQPHDRPVAPERGDVRLRLACLQFLGARRDAGGTGGDDGAGQQGEQKETSPGRARRPEGSVSPAW